MDIWKKRLRKLNNIIGIVSLIFSLLAICIATYRTPELGFDYQGVIVGALTILVTILIGWQIYNGLSLETKIGKTIDNFKIESNKILKRNNQLALVTSQSVNKELFEFYCRQESSIEPVLRYGLNYFDYSLRLKDINACNVVMYVFKKEYMPKITCIRKFDKENIIKFANLIQGGEAIDGFTEFYSWLVNLKSS